MIIAILCCCKRDNKSFSVPVNKNDKAEKDFVLKDNASFRSGISKINNKLIGNAYDLDIVMPMYNLSEYSHNYSMISENLWGYIETKSIMLMLMILLQNNCFYWKSSRCSLTSTTTSTILKRNRKIVIYFN